MESKRINSEKEFIGKIHELGGLFGFDFESDDNGIFITINGKKTKMEFSSKGFFYIENMSQKICFNQMFIQRLLGTSCLIEIYVTNGKDRAYCKFDQGLCAAPSGTTGELPNFTFSEYVNGKTHTFFSNVHQIETMEADTLINPIYDKIMFFENLQLSNINKQINNNFTRFLFGVNSEIKNCYVPLVQLDIIRKKVEHSFKLFSSEFSIIYNEWLNIYKYNSAITCYSIPFIDKIYSKTLKQTCEFVNELPLPEKYSVQLLSIVRKKDAIDCFDNTINYFSNSIAWPYISKYYLDSIEYIRSMQNAKAYKDLSKLSNFNCKLLKR